MERASGAAPPAATSYEQSVPKSSQTFVTIILLLIVGIASLVIAEQVLTGWLALGERANISRRNWNPIELTVMIGCFFWGIASLYTAWGFWRHPSAPSLRDYFERKDTQTAPGVMLTIVLLIVVGVLCLVIAEQVLTGWLALGERANISRRDLNAVEWMTIVIATLWGLVNLRTAWGLLTRDRRAWAWAQWTVLLTALVGLTVFLAGLIKVYTVVPVGGTMLDNLPGTQEMTAPGLLITLSCIAVYRFLTVHVDLTAAQTVRNRLAQTPGAGAIIGFIAIFVGFSIASPLFLEPRAQAGALSTNISNGIIAIGITMLMISGEFDLSVGSIYGASALVFILAMTEGVLGMPPMAAIPAAIVSLLFAALLGMINGVVRIVTGIPSFIVTLGTLLAYRAIPLVIIPDGRIIRYADYRIPEPLIYVNRWLMIAGLLFLGLAILYMGIRTAPRLYRRLKERLANYANDASDFRAVAVAWLAVRLLFTVVATGVLIILIGMSIVDLAGQTDTLLEVSFFNLANGRIGSLPFIGALDPGINLRVGIIWWFLLVIIFQFILMNTPYGSYTFAVGGNPGAARAQGISARRIKVSNFMLSAVLAGVAGIIYVARVGSVNANLGEGLELEVIAAAVIGGTLLEGGYGSIFGAFLGVLIFGILQTGLVLIGMDPRVFFGVIGIIIIVAVVINRWVQRVRT
jgi:ribose/xylose/arabinose/galactoside ABC-type transport system permease subunit